MPWEQRVGVLAAVVVLYCLGTLTGGILQARSAPLATLLAWTVLMAVVANAVIRRRHDRRVNL